MNNVYLHRDVAFNVDTRCNNAKGIRINLPEQYNDPEERIINLCENALKSAIDDWGGNISDYKNVSVIIGSGIGLCDKLHPIYKNFEINKFILSSLAKKIKNKLNINAEFVVINNACSAGSQAISYGFDLLTLNQAELVIAGGVDIFSLSAYMGFLRLNAIDLEGCKPFDKNRRGITVSEGSVFFVMEKETCSPKNNCKKRYCEIAGCGITNDAYHIVQMNPKGTEIIKAIDDALLESNLSKNDIDLIITHGTGTIINDKIESDIIYKYFLDQLSDLSITAPKSIIGHTGGASGSFGVLFAIGSLLYHEIPFIKNLKEIDDSISEIPLVKDNSANKIVKTVLVNSFAFGGTNVIICCKN